MPRDVAERSDLQPDGAVQHNRVNPGVAPKAAGIGKLNSFHGLVQANPIDQLD